MRELLAETLAKMSMGMIQNSASHIFFEEKDIPVEMLKECKEKKEQK